ncbi:putative arabinose efflux permease, MFS family [Streptoalloteichus tenebrarius]|uniref:Arabinose efflux permease, MFS family n=1 Tax=Streptoalloteichus tenebrarius (strain ATCC 17920 / DSM 40477 / JCM 4838 / CBS 697.72 / NBRC 16177 / NCIMB 11028 / NRRL B-12390 / A12253. 1 / ISP 5477) TaxID=1933 RepID=A0ABT1HYU8_STRSD|nr:MFS transporter [Streptoalloteichus tenebrarius]MCP2260703.1 putative arabinose efflux permease, MFS family [Streptoalloteichus tenebrarius]BFF03764.1 MFS transporter [Streptoalloteichus tenebrarius]
MSAPPEPDPESPLRTDSAVEPGRGTVRSHPRFLRAWVGQVAGAVGDQLIPVALSLYVARQGGGPGVVGIVLGGRVFALVLCLLVGGVLADRVRRSRLLVGVDVYRASLLVLTALFLDALPLTALALVTLLVGAGEAMARPAYRSLVPSLLPTALLERGNALVSAGMRSSAVLGSLAGATIVSLTGARAALLLAAVTFGAAALTVLGLGDTRPRKSTTSVLADAAAGVRAVRERPWVLAVMVAVSVQLLAGTATALTLLPLIAQRELGGEIAYGVVLSALALGALPGVVVAGRWQPTRRGTMSMLALAGYAALPWSLVGPLPLPLTIAAFALGGFVVEFYFVYWISALQRGVPPEVLGKVLALDQLGSFALLPLGYLLVGPAVSAFGERDTLIVAGIIVAAASLVTLLVPGVATFQEAPRSRARPDRSRSS